MGYAHPVDSSNVEVFEFDDVMLMSGSPAYYTTDQDYNRMRQGGWKWEGASLCR